MTIEFDYDAGRHRLAIRGKLTIHHATEAIAQLRGRDRLALDLAEVAELDAAGLQLLLAARRDCGLRVAAVSDAVANVLRLTGLVELMEAQA